MRQSFSQHNVEILDPINYDCYNLKDDKIKSLQLPGNYIGRIMLKTECDTINKTLIHPKLIYAKLYSTIDELDTIEIKFDTKIGNYKFLDDNMSKILDHISYLRIEKVLNNNCIIAPRFNIPIMIISENK